MKFRIVRGDEAETVAMPRGRGIQKRFVDVAAVDVHLNLLRAGEPGGRYHHHTSSDNVYIVKRGTGRLVVEGESHTIREDDVVYIPAGLRHSLTNAGDGELELFEIYAPAGDSFDFVIDS